MPRWRETRPRGRERGRAAGCTVSPCSGVSNDRFHLIAESGAAEPFSVGANGVEIEPCGLSVRDRVGERDRKSTRLDSSHEWNSYADICLKKKDCKRRVSNVTFKK